MNKEKNHNLYRVLEGAHYGTKEKFSSYEERVNFLTNYAVDAKRIYEEYKERPEKIKDKETREKFEQFSLYRQFENEVLLVEIFRANVRKACRIAELIREAEKEGVEKEELKKLQIRFAIAKAEVNKFINSLGPLLEFAHRRVIKKERAYYDFVELNKEKAELEVLTEIPLGESVIAQEIFEKKAKSDLQEEKIKMKLINIAQARDFLREDVDLPKILEDPVILAELKNLSKKTGEDLLAYADELIRKKEEKERIPSSKKEAEERLNEVKSRLESLWKNDFVRYKVYQRYLENLIRQDQLGDPVLEIPSVTKLMNKISSWERRHTETPIGAVLIGPPGTGKSLGIEHYLATHPEHKKKGPPVIIDMSQETTEFILLGGEAIEITDKAATVKMLKEVFDQEKIIEEKLKSKELSSEEKDRLLSNKTLLHKNIEDLINAFQGQYIEFKKEVEKTKELQVDKVAEEAGKELINEAKNQKLSEGVVEKIKESIKNALTKWQAGELGKIMYGNGWRDGIILKALKEGRDIIINEYNNFRLPPDALRQLFQTAYGGEWFFAGTARKYPVYSRIYLTANEGSSSHKFFYDTAQITAAFASRLPAPIEVELPSQEEEILIVQTKLSDNNKNFLCNKEIRAKLYAIEALKDAEFSLKYNEKELITYLFKKVLPRLRALTSVAPKEVPSLDLRHVDRFCRDLVNRHTRERNRISVEEAFIKNFCQPFMSNSIAWETFCKSGIIEEMYKVGLLHQKAGTEVYNFLIKVLAKKRGEELEYISEEAKRNVLTKLETELQQYDAELIRNLEKMEGEEKWSEIVKKATKEKKILIINPYLKEALPTSFSKYSPMPEERAF